MTTVPSDASSRAESAPFGDRSSEGRHGRVDSSYDVVVIGGGFAGASTALLLRRWLPDARILVVERTERFERKVGEATVEVSAIFLHRVLGLYDHLSTHHLPKHGLRYWFGDGSDRRLHELTEVGPWEMPRLPSFQLDRPTLDRHLLATAAAEGCEVVRPAKVTAIEPGWPESRLKLRQGETERTVVARWVVDASGRQSFLARKWKLHRRVDEHTTAAVWGRWRGFRDLDGIEAIGSDPREPALPPVSASRRLATNHFCGYGWWCWVIPLADGQTSIGVVRDKTLYDLPGQGSLKDRYLEFVRTTPGLRELAADAEMVPDGAGRDDFMALSHLPYVAEQYMDRGWALVGDSGAFLDPYYSPGLDHAAISIFATARILEKDLGARLRGEELPSSELEALVERHNGEFSRSYQRWLEALYLGKYELLGDAELVRCAFLVDTALYYLGVVTPIHRDLEALANPVFGIDLPQATYAYRLTRAFNRRLRILARFRRRVGTYGRRNIGDRHLSRAFDVGPGSAIRPLRAGLGIWLRLELEKLLHHLRHGRVDVSTPVKETPSATASSAPMPSTAST